MSVLSRWIGVASVLALGFLVACPANNAVGPTADFSASPLTGLAPLTVNFTDLSNPGSKKIDHWDWSFDDQGTSNLQDPVHTFLYPGRYTIPLTVATAARVDTKTRLDYIVAGGEGEGEEEGEEEGEAEGEGEGEGEGEAEGEGEGEGEL